VSSGSPRRHARRRPGVARWADRRARSGPIGLRPDGDRDAPRPAARFDPLIHPVAITGHCVIGDQIRVPAAWCDVAGCGAAFADPAALGEGDNRARATGAGWAEDAVGRLVCPACQQREHAAAARRALPGEPVPAGDRQAAAGPGRPAGGVSPSVPPAVWRPPAARQGRHHRGRSWPGLRAALAGGRNSWMTGIRPLIPDAAGMPGRARTRAPARPPISPPPDPATGANVHSRS
jgi:hypothetical protein